MPLQKFSPKPVNKAPSPIFPSKVTLPLWQSTNVLDASPSSTKESENPTSLKNILSVLRSSSKGVSFEAISNEDSPSDVCCFKHIGDVSQLSNSSKLSFRELKSDGEDSSDSENDEQKQLKSPYSKDLQEDCRDDEESEDENGSLLQDLFITKLKIDKEINATVQRRYQERCSSYLRELKKIQDAKIEYLREREDERDKYLKMHYKSLEDLHYIASVEASKKEQKYQMEAEVHWQTIQQELEAAEALEAEKHASAVQEFKELLDLFISTYEKLKLQIKTLKSHSLNEGIEKSLSETVLRAKEAFERIQADVYGSSQLIQLKKELKTGLEILKKINTHLESQPPPPPTTIKEQETVPREASPQKSDASVISWPASSPQPVVQPPTTKAVSVSSTSSSLASYLSTFKILREKNQQLMQLAQKMKENTSLRPLLSRGIGIVNQFDNSANNSANRSKLQQIINMLSGRTFYVGDTPCSIGGDASAEAFIKDQLPVSLITLAHDKQVGSMAIYASLIVRIWLLFPDVGNLILYRLYEACPFLVPLILTRESFNSDEEFHRALGMRHKDKGNPEPVDKYLTRMEALAQLFGRIVSMEVKDKAHPHGLDEGWKWLARTLSFPPQPSVTACLISGFLSAAGHALLTAYGEQFKKVLIYIADIYFPQMEADTLGGGGSSLSNLRKLLNTFHSKGIISPPEPDNKLML